MANTLITPDNVAKAALATYQYNAVLPRLVNRVFQTEFGGGSGDTITIRQQASLTANLFNRGTGVVPQNITEGSTTFTVGDLYDVSAVITQEQWDLELTDFSFQVAEPMGKAMVRKSENVINDALELLTPATGSYSTLLADILEARGVLNAAEVPLDSRILVVGSDVAAKLVLLDNLIKAEQAGGDTGALRDARIGRLFGMQVVESVIVDPAKAFVWHKDAVTFAAITPAVPQGAARSSVQSYDGAAMRVVFDYDASKKQDLVSGDAYLQAKTIRTDAIAAIAFA